MGFKVLNSEIKIFKLIYMFGFAKCSFIIYLIVHSMASRGYYNSKVLPEVLET